LQQIFPDYGFFSGMEDLLPAGHSCKNILSFLALVP
jgi:hypothetical protein